MIPIGIHEIRYALTWRQICYFMHFPNNLDQVKWIYFDKLDYLIPWMSQVSFWDRVEQSVCVKSEQALFLA